MFKNLIDAFTYSFTFYVVYTIIFRMIQVNKYVKKSTSDGTYSETYKLVYSKNLKGKCILISILMGVFNLADNYTTLVFSTVIVVVTGRCLLKVFDKYYPEPKDSL